MGVKVLGVDEAGRGPVIGPLIMVGFMVDEEKLPDLKSLGVKDSKMLTPEKRELIARKLKNVGQAFIRTIEPHQIDGFNLNRLEMMAVRDIILEASPDKAVIDAFEKNLEEKLGLKTGHGFQGKIIAEHKADAKYVVVGAASIVAKVHRDSEISKLHQVYGDFGSGYPGDPKTSRYVNRLVHSKQKLPDFVRRSWDTVKRIMEEESQVRLAGFLED